MAIVYGFSNALVYEFGGSHIGLAGVVRKAYCGRMKNRMETQVIPGKPQHKQGLRGV